MAEVEVTLIRRDSTSETIRRPLHRAGNRYAVTFKRQKWAIDNKRCHDLRTAKPLPDDVALRFATPKEAAELMRRGTVNGSVSAPQAKHTMEVASPPPASDTPLLVVIPAKDPDSDEFDLSQMAVIRDSVAARQLVDAGPGTGKTAVACARVAWLASEANIPPAQIWLISFTRTAVQEIRDRVARLLNRGVANAVQMATLDSMAWQLNSGFNPGASISGSFEDNIRALHGELEENQAVQDYLLDLRHLIIDEAQDIVGERADLLVALLEKLPPSCGVTVFSDEAQAIYGFAAMEEDDVHGRTEPKVSLPGRIRGSVAGKSFVRRVLDQVHRTSDERLKTIFTQVRLEVLDTAGSARDRNQAVRQRLKNLAHCDAPRRIEEAAADLPNDAFILFRQRIEAIRASASLRRAGIQHRLRMSGLPVTIAPWIAAALGEADEPRIGERAFVKLWAEHVAGTPLATINEIEAFQLLKSFAPDSTERMIDLKLLRNRLARKPPPSVAHVELGAAGPIVSTIHASKGREAASVTLMMPALASGEKETELAIDEETRVLFVAATRTRQQLRIADARPMKALKARGRAYRFDKWNDSPKCDFELGRSSDLTASGLAGRSYFSDRSVVQANRKSWIDLAAGGATLEAYKRKLGDQWRFCICTEYGASHLAVLAEHIDDDLWEAAKSGARHFRLGGSSRKPKKLAPIHLMGLTTIAVGANDPEGEVLIEPWKTTGLILAPVLYGLPRFTVKTTDV